MIREGFKRLFDWEGHGCQVVGDYLCEVIIDFPVLDFDKRQMIYKTQIPVCFPKK